MHELFLVSAGRTDFCKFLTCGAVVSTARGTSLNLKGGGQNRISCMVAVEMSVPIVPVRQGLSFFRNGFVFK